MNACAQLRTVNCRTGLEGEREEKGVQREGERRVNMAEECEGFLVAAMVDVRGQELCVREQTEIVGSVGTHFLEFGEICEP